jgi:hypothetical protein
VTLELGGKKIALLHGTHEEIVGALAKSGSFDVVVRGHTHRAGITGERPLIINPGEVCGYLSGQRTVAVFDTAEMRGEIISL